MKKIILTSIFSTLVCVASFGQTLYRSILSHNGSLTQYDINSWTDALTDAVDGDTIYFTTGTFPGDITITKKIALIGSGVCESQAWYYSTSELQEALGGSGTPSDNSTNFTGVVNIELDDSPTLTATMLEGINISNNVRINKTVKNLKIKRCQISTLGTNVDEVSDESAKPDSLTLESCYITTLMAGNLVDPLIYNCYFTNDHLYSQPLNFTNCSIDYTTSSVGCNYINCLLFQELSYGINTFLNCIDCEDHSDIGSTYTNCWTYYSGDGTRPWYWSKDYLSENEYIGNDGNVVGPLGGTAPFTFIPSQPYVSSSSVAYDASSKILNVNITVKKGK